MICNKDKCTGCYACYNACPKECIMMQEDDNGHIYPKVRKENCINCRLCYSVCQSLSNVKFNEPKKAYACWALNNLERETSTSGGAASVFSRNVLKKNNGIVFGAAVINKDVQHIRVENEGDLVKLKGSKYVQSKIGNTYKQAKMDLDNNKEVLFIGTPCQIAGLKKYLKKVYSNLLTIDIICHGVPSYKMLSDYIKSNGDVNFDNIIFRDKDGFNFKLLDNNKVVFSETMKESLYYRGFMEALFYRENCYECKYATRKRVSDITIGDFWGIGEENEFLKSTKGGVSVLLPCTEKGLDFIYKCQDDMFLEERSIDEAIKGNDQLRHSSIKNKNYNKFKELYNVGGFNYAALKCMRKEIFLGKLKEILYKNKFTYNLARGIKKIVIKNN